MAIRQNTAQFTADAVDQIKLYGQDTLQSCMLSNGNFAIGYITGTTTLKVQLWNGSTYAQIGSTQTVTSTLANVYFPFSMCSVNGSTKFAVFYGDTTSGTQKPYYAVYDNTCTQVLAPTLVENITASGYYTIASLSSGNLVMGWSGGTLGYSQFTIWTPLGVQVQAPTIPASTGNKTNNWIAVLTNDFFVFINDGASSTGRFTIYDPSTNPATQKVAYTEYSANIFGFSHPNEVHPLMDKNFAIYYNDEQNSVGSIMLVMVYQYVNDTTWINLGSYRPFTEENNDYFAGFGASDVAQNLFIANYPGPYTNGQYSPMTNVMQGPFGATLSQGPVRMYIPYPNKFTSLPITCRMQIINDKRIVYFWRDTSDSNKGKFLVYQIPHFQTTISSNTVTIKNNTTLTQNINLSITY